jgi:hypothetical protein
MHLFLFAWFSQTLRPERPLAHGVGRSWVQNAKPCAELFCA